MGSVLDFCKGLTSTTFNDGDVLMQEGHSSNKFYVLIKGECEILRGEFRINKVSEPGSIFGEMSILLNIPHMATVKSIGKTELYEVDNALDFLQSNTEITFHLAKGLAKRLNGITSYLVDIKNQFKGKDDHYSIVDEVLESLVYNQDDEDIELGSDRDTSGN